MRNSKRRELQGTSDEGRESRTEALLVEGLDHYFEGRHEDAIHLWTRLLFLDRSHARARAYISRARSALAERQRLADEALHAAADRLDRGALDEAKRLLAEAERLGGGDEQAAGLWARLDRSARTHAAGERPADDRAVIDVRPLRRGGRRVRTIVQLLAAGVFGMLLATAAASPVVGDWLAGGAPMPDAPPGDVQPVTILSPSEVALVRARNYFARGRLAEALRALDEASAAGEVESREVERLRIEIQNWLLADRRVAGSETPLP